MKSRRAFFSTLLLSLSATHLEAWECPLSEGWSITLENQKPGEDPEHLVHFEDGVLHMYRDVPAGEKVPFGVVTTDKSFSRYHLRFEYRWIGKRFEPRARELRDAGVLYHVQDASTVWPSGPECQIQEGDTGDLIYIRTGGLTWMRPAGSPAPDGQGDPGLLPENGGVPRFFEPSWPYIGRFEEADSPSGWNRVDIFVDRDESVHIVNGRIIARSAGMVGVDGKPLTEGRICFQLEGAEIQYRNLEIDETSTPAVETDSKLVSLSSVKGHDSRKKTVKVVRPAGSSINAVRLVGTDAASFEIVERNEGSDEWTIAFHPQHGRGRYSAGLEIGTPSSDSGPGTVVFLQGIALDAFEGENEPPLQDIVHALGIPLDVGGTELSLNKEEATIGESVDASYFTAVGGGKIRITQLARFSPPGATPIGIFFRGKEELTEIGRLAESGNPPDAHQSLLPPWQGGMETIEIDAPAEPFGFYMQGHHYTSFTDPERPSEATIPRTTRIYPVRFFQNERRENAWIVGFEEASNGDYQDSVLLVEGVQPVEAP